ncbi:hypothetical protein CASFOL_034872 [Castilleja foliolosa]|uniref:Uncharacterized protein n=1 Tax=Castilleja foliolosa TaxID=1961234 RepID=A0ABD3BTE3_9LAMI
MSQTSIVSSQPIDINNLRSRIAELRNVEENPILGSEEEKLQNEVADELESKINRVCSEYCSNLSSLSREEIDEILGVLKKKLVEVGTENADMDCEIEKLQWRYSEDYGKMESELEKICCSLETIESQNHEKAKEDMQKDVVCLTDGHTAFHEKLQSRIAELRNVEENPILGSEEEKLQNEVADELESKINRVCSEYCSNLSSLSREEIDEILGVLKKKLVEVGTENADMDCEIEKLQWRYSEDYGKMESELEKICCSLETIESQNHEKAKEDMQKDVVCLTDGHTPIDINNLRSRIAELRNVEENPILGSEEEKLQNEVADELESKINRICSEYCSNLSSLPREGIDEILGVLKKELVEVGTENADMDCEIEKLKGRFSEDYGKMESELEKICYSLEIIESRNPEKAEEDIQKDVVCLTDGHTAFPNDTDSNFKMLELSHQIENNKTTLKSLQDLDSMFRRFEVVEKIEAALTGLRIIEVEGNSIRLSLKTYVPYFETVLQQQDIENVTGPLEMNHELMIETVDGTQELKNAEVRFTINVSRNCLGCHSLATFVKNALKAEHYLSKSCSDEVKFVPYTSFSKCPYQEVSLEAMQTPNYALDKGYLLCFSGQKLVYTRLTEYIVIFPNDVYIGEILDAAKTFRQPSSTFSAYETRSSLEFFVRRVLDRIAISSLRRFVVKNANKSRHSFEYLDREDTIVAHLVGGVDAFLKLPQGWPLSDLALELKSLKSTNQYSKEISLSFLCDIMETANSLNKHLRHNIKSFADHIEEILMKQTREKLQPVYILKSSH